mgnify:CR=1 FL=1
MRMNMSGPKFKSRMFLFALKSFGDRRSWIEVEDAVEVVLRGESIVFSFQ